MNKILSFRDIDITKVKVNNDKSDINLLKNNQVKPKEINKVLNNRLFDLKNNYKAHIMDFHPEVTRHKKKI